MKKIFAVFIICLINTTAWGAASSSSSSGPRSSASIRHVPATQKDYQQLIQLFLSEWVPFGHKIAFSNNLEVYQDDSTQILDMKSLQKTAGETRVIYNHDDFAGLVKGRRGLFDVFMPGVNKGKHLPNIGYTITLPPKGIKVKAVIMRVYGGVSLKVTTATGEIKPLDALLLQQGIALVDLNLRDVISGAAHQKLLTAQDDEAILRDIQHFKSEFDQIAQMHSRVPMYLMGNSWGGRTAVQMALKHPDSFDGYISHAGALGQSQRYTSLEKRKLIEKNPDWKQLYPDTGLERLTKPIMLIHAEDDSRVPLMSSILWYKKASQAGKRDLITLYVIEKSNKVSAKTSTKDLTTRGHGAPQTGVAVLNYANAIIDFINRNGEHNEKSRQLTRTQYKTYKQHALAKSPAKFNLKERVLSKAILLEEEQPGSVTANVVHHFIYSELAAEYMKKLLKTVKIVNSTQLNAFAPRDDEAPNGIYLGMLTSEILPHFLIYARERLNKEGVTYDPNVVAQQILQTDLFAKEVHVKDLTTFLSNNTRAYIYGTPNWGKARIDFFAAIPNTTLFAFLHDTLGGDEPITHENYQIIIRSKAAAYWTAFQKFLAKKTSQWPEKPGTVSRRLGDAPAPPPPPRRIVRQEFKPSPSVGIPAH